MAGTMEPTIAKRSLEGPDVSVASTKKSKLDVSGVASEESAPRGGVNSSELASAFALASLASLSPTTNVDKTKTEVSTKAAAGTVGAMQSARSFEETRSPMATQAPITPDQRSPGSPGSKSSESDDSEPEEHRRVHFAPSTKSEPATPTSILKTGRGAQSKRKITLPVQHQTNSAFVGGPRMHVGYGANVGGFSPHGQLPYRQPMHPPHGHYSPHPHHAQQWYHSPVGVPPMAGRMGYVPQRLMQPPLLHPENQWICDYCNVAAFSSYDEACLHEEACKVRNCKDSSAPGAVSQSHSEEMSATPVDLPSGSSDAWHTGTMSLAMEESDHEWLSDLNCFIRKHCVEVFSAEDIDVSHSSKRGRIAPRQVGIRCCFCSHLPSKEKAVAAVSFPTSIAGIYESVKRWQRVHLEICESVPQDKRDQLALLSKTNVWVPTTRQYWTDSAKALGLVDTNEGIRFGSPPRQGAMAKDMASVSINRPVVRAPAAQSAANLHQTESSGAVGATDTATAHSTTPSSLQYVVFPEDKDMIPPYVYTLMRQVEPCQFTEADRFVARSKGPVGYPGFQCRHCKGHAGLGKYFPVSAKSLSTNSTSQNIHAHLLKCRKCPEQVKDQLVQLKIEKGRSPRLEPGWRKIFFDKVWSRLHG
eukprot:Nitzschia sp. Nitz4//scaffold151_size53849//17389//19320//NITZ4_006718-RA/size53849-processed-gene-0.58-mRNA-1//1//CDS//3329537129//1414//frame0